MRTAGAACGAAFAASEGLDESQGDSWWHAWLAQVTVEEELAANPEIAAEIESEIEQNKW